MIRLRKDEREQVVAALEAEYDSPEDAAQALFGLCFSLLSKRSTQAVHVNWGSGVIYGPYGNAVDAKRAAKLAAATFAPEDLEGAVRVIPLGAPESLSGANVEAPRANPYVCQACQHPMLAHFNKRWTKPKGKVWNAPGCVVSGCSCKEAA